MKVLITGSKGQLGWELQRTVPNEVEPIALSSADLDITDRAAVKDAVKAYAPNIIINAAAYTAVDQAEDESERAFAVNRDGIANLAEAAKNKDIRMVHISTDFVFDGKKSSPYLPDDRPCPLGVYGQSKYEGEERLLAVAGGENCAIIRTAWVYSSHGNNFVKTMLKLMSARDQLSVVADQVGTPTWANGLAKAVWSVALKKLDGVYHWTDAGTASWYDFAHAIQEEALRLDLLTKSISILPLQAKDYPLPAKRPAYSILDKTSLWNELGTPAPHWRESLKKMLQESKNA